MKYPEQLASDVKNFIADLRAEVVAAELIDRGVKQDEISFNTKGIKRRPFSRDIFEIKLPNDDDEHYKILLNREGIYDSLPEAIFHQPLNSKPFKSKEEILDEIKIQRQEEIEARKFFFPMENEFNQLRLLLEITERKSNDNFSGSSVIQLFYKLFGTVSYFNNAQIAVLLSLLPNIYELKGELKILSKYYSLLLGDEIKIKMKNEIRNHHLEKQSDEIILGVSSLTSNQLTYSEQIISIEIWPKENNRISLYLNDGICLKILNFLNDYFLPFEFEKKLDLLLPEKNRASILGDLKSPSFLGANSYI